MSQSDLYAPPAASVAGPTPAELTAKANGEVVLAGIGQRIGATLIDGLVLTPLFALDAYVGTMSRSADIAMGVVTLIANALVYVVMVGLYGGSPGKLLLGMRVAMADGGRVTWKAAVLRNSVYLAATVAVSVGTFMAVLAMPDDSYLAQGYLARTTALSAQTPEWVMLAYYVMFAWMFASFISLLVTKRRRALYDFQAGTIVVRSL